MSMSPDPRGTPVLPAAEAGRIPAARFDLEFRGAVVPEELIVEARATAHAQGYAAGWGEGRRQAAAATRSATDRADAMLARVTAEWADRQEHAVVAIAAAARSLEQRAVQPAAEVEEMIMRAAVTLTETLLGHELAVSRTPGEDAMRRALALAPVGRPVLVRLHPDEYAAVASTSNHREIDGRTVTLIADPTLRSGDAVALCDATTIDARLSAALDRVRALFTTDPADAPAGRDPGAAAGPGPGW